jgi:hypothetical protein
MEWWNHEVMDYPIFQYSNIPDYLHREVSKVECIAFALSIVLDTSESQSLFIFRHTPDSLIPPFYLSPIDDLEEVFHILGPSILILEIVGMLPHIAHQ